MTLNEGIVLMRSTVELLALIHNGIPEADREEWRHALRSALGASLPDF